jgi:hypothetical protein
MGARWPAWTFAVGVLAAVGALAFAIVRYPGVADDQQAPIWLAALVAIVGAYVVVAVVALLRRTSPAMATGVWFGLAAGLAWVAEVWFQAPARLPASMERTAGGVCALVAAAVTVAAGITEGARTGSGRRAALTGLWTGLISGTVMATGLVTVQLSNLGLLGARADYQAELTSSGYVDMATYLASDAIAAALMHMVLNVLLGLLGAGAGALVASANRPRAAVASS